MGDIKQDSTIPHMEEPRETDMAEDTPAISSPLPAGISTGQVIYLSGSDVEALMRWVYDDFHVARFCSWDTETLRDQAIACMTNEAIPRPLLQLILDEDTLIGLIFVKPNYGTHDICRAEVGFCLDRQYFRRGIVKRVLREVVIPTVFGDWPDLRRLEAKVEMNDSATRMMLETVGFHVEGILRDYRVFEGRTVDVAMCSFLSSNLRVGQSFA